MTMRSAKRYCVAAAVLAAVACNETEAPQALLEAPPDGIAARPRWLTFTCVEPGCETTRVTSIRLVGTRPVAIKRVVLSEAERTDFEIDVDQSTPFILDVGDSVEIRATLRPTGDPRLGDVDVLVTYTDASADESEGRIEPGELAIPLVRRLIGEPRLQVDPPRLLFGEVLPSARKTLPLAILNSGFGNVGVVVESVESDVPEIRVGNMPTHAVLPEARWDLDVTFAPIEERFIEGLITVTSADRSAEPALVSVAGTSIPRPTIAAYPDTGVDFGEVPVGAMQMAQLEIANHGSDVLELYMVEIIGRNGGTNLTVSLPTRTMTATIASLTSIVATVELNAVTPGEVDAFVRIRSNDRANRTFDVPINALVTQPDVGVSPLAIDFGVTPRGWSLMQRIEVTNNGYGNLLVNNVARVLGSSELYTIQNLPALPAMLRHNERMGFEIEFRAEAVATFNGTIGIETNDPDTEFVEVSLTAQGASCEVGCPIANGTPTCAGGECAIGACNLGWYDTDQSAATGCECAEIGRDPGAFCADGHWAGTLIDGDGDRAVFTGILAEQDDIDIITFFGKDEGQLFGDDYDVRVRLETSDPNIEMCVYRHNTAQHQATCSFENESCGRSFRRDGGYGREDGADYVVKISRRAGAAPTCTPFTVFMRNG